MEVFHSSALAYASKRFDYDYDTMFMRKSMAVLDYNHHLHRRLKTDPVTGQPIVYNKWSRAANNFTPVFPKVSSLVFQFFKFISHNFFISDPSEK